MWTLGDFRTGATVSARFFTTDPTGAPITLAGTPAARVRKGTGSGSTSTAGVTLAVDVVTGQHIVGVDLSADGTFYAAGSECYIELSAGTVNGVSQVGVVVAQFSIENRSLQNRIPAALVSGRMDSSIGAVASGAIAAASFAAGAFADVWTVATRVLTAGTNIVLAKGTGVTGFNDPTAGQNADAVWDEGIAAHNSPATFGWYIQTGLYVGVSGVVSLLDTLVGKTKRYFQLALRKDAGIAVDGAAELAELNEDAGSGAGAYANTTDAQEAIRDNMGTPQTGDAFARLGAPAGLSHAADVAAVKADTAATLVDTNELQTDWANGGRLDSILDSRASSDEATAIQNNTRVVRVTPDVIERPDSGTVTYRIELTLYDHVGNMEAPDAAPTIALVNQSGTDRSSRLDSTTMALVSTGRYRAIYTADAADALEQLVWTFSVVEGGNTRVYPNTSLVVDTTAVDFTAADRNKLETLATDYTTARAGKIDNLDATISSRATPAQVKTQADQAIADAALATAANLATAKAAIDLIKLKTDLLPSDPADQSALESAISIAQSALAGAIAALNNLSAAQVTAAVPTAAQNADKLLGRNIAGGSDGGRVVTDALRPLRNRVDSDDDSMTVFEEDDTTPAWTATVTRADRDALESVNPS